MKIRNKGKVEEPVVCSWWVNRGGYKWATSRQVVTGRREGIFRDKPRPENWLDQPWLVPTQAESNADAFHFNEYAPLTNAPLLHRILGFNGTDMDSIVFFASKYGLLGYDSHSMKLAAGAPYVPITPYGRLGAEALSSWTRAICDLRTLVQLWVLLRSTKEESAIELATLFRLSEERDYLVFVGWDKLNKETDSTHGFPVHEDSGLSRACGLHGCPPDSTSAKLVKEGVRRFLRDNINRAFYDLADPVIDVRQPSPILIHPRNLLGAAYTMLAQELTGQTGDGLQCPGCTKWFFPLHGRSIYCSEKCKVRTYRKRKKEKTRG
jgi:hypothetical protein